MEAIEQALRLAFRRESPSEGFADRVHYRQAMQTAAASRATWQRLPETPRPLGSVFLAPFQRLFSGTTLTASENLRFQGLRSAERSPAPIALSFAAHLAVLGMIGFFLVRLHVKAITPQTQTTAVNLSPWLPRPVLSGGGGGGGDHSAVEVSKGRLPRLDRQQIDPPQVLRNDRPKLAVEPTLMMPKDIPLPNTDMPNLGLPSSTQVQMASNGTGIGAGMGSGRNGGIGSGIGNGLGPGYGGGTGGGLYHVGGGVSAPVPTFEPDPEYTDEARRAKYTGIVVVSLIVDAQGLAERVHVVRALGMGLDAKAVEAVKQYRFKPACYQGKPVPVEVNIEVNFQIY